MLRLTILILLALINPSFSQTTCNVPCLIVGTEGPQGPQGPTGPQGIQGPIGPSGGSSTGSSLPGGRLTGLATAVDVIYHQNSFINSQSGASGTIAVVGWNGTAQGHATVNSSDTTLIAGSVGGVAQHIETNAIGLNTATMFVAKANTTASTLFGGTVSPGFSVEANSVLFARFKG